MWLVLRKKEAINDALKKFHNECQSYNLKVRDIVKFGRVNFKISALSSKKLNDNIQGIEVLNQTIFDPNALTTAIDKNQLSVVN